EHTNRHARLQLLDLDLAALLLGGQRVGERLVGGRDPAGVLVLEHARDALALQLVAQHADSRAFGLHLFLELGALGFAGVLLEDQLLAALARVEHALLAREHVERQRALARDFGLPRSRRPAAGGAEQRAHQPGPDRRASAQARTSLPNAIRATCSILS